MPCHETETLASRGDGQSLPLKPQAYEAKPELTACSNLLGQNAIESKANRPCTMARCLETQDYH